MDNDKFNLQDLKEMLAEDNTINPLLAFSAKKFKELAEKAVSRLLEVSNDNYSQAARIANISRPTLYTYLEFIRGKGKGKVHKRKIISFIEKSLFYKESESESQPQPQINLFQ